MEKQKGHILVLTYPAQGHINPLLQFAKRLASKGLKATLATTHYTVKSICATTVGVEPISDGYDEGGFKQAPSVEAYLESFRTVGSRTFADIILKYQNSDSPVDCIVYDSLLPWVLDVARQFGVYGAVILTVSASVCSMFWQINQGLLTLPMKQETMPLLLPGLPSLEFCDLPSFLAQPASNRAYLAEILEKFARLNENDWVFCNSFQELESELVETMLGHWPLVMIGPMVPSAYLDQQIEGDSAYGASLWKPTSEESMRWLDTKPENSVIYVSFGSMADIAATQVEEIAWGLKASNRPFLWVAKENENKLPVDFVKSVGDTGCVLTWCNQLEVLAHPAVGCFVTHCGWNSTLEGLSLGVPMVAVPHWSDQPTNTKFVEDVWKVGVRVKKDEQGIVKGEELKRCIEEIMDGERSEEFKRNASKWREFAKKTVSVGGSSDRNIDEFVMKMMKGERKRNF
ncbi:flavonol 7-O-beta-glucosyltransferase UGT74F1-like [Pistacia vera]|uniref:flavonol 7-O-beta-glucosyltransferase UGT74F1-like n=1 Tax=Pistacia vera TaxID=55513 RepID=UPI0012636E8B|nr:flavonol 7-O-beta-glucosyltransferase UGT74F1-like [Pistacia vera]